MSDDAFDHRRIKPDEVIFSTLIVGNADGTIDGNDLMEGVHGTLEAAIEGAEENVDEYGGTLIVYRCTPVCRLERAPVVVTEITPRRTRKARA